MHRLAATFAALGAVSLAAAPALAQGMRGAMANSHMTPRGAPAGAPSTDAFLRQAAQSDRFEIAEGHAALKMARNAEIKAFARQMIHDHTASSAQLKAAAARAHIAMPPPPPLSAEQQRKIGETSKMAPMGGFDGDYVNDQVMAHRQALELMSAYAAHGSSAAVRAAAGKIVPVVRGHLSMIEAIQRKMPKGAMGNMKMGAGGKMGAMHHK